MKRIRPLKKVLLGLSGFLLLFVAGAQKASAFVVPVAAKAGLWILGALGLFKFGKDVAEKLIEFIADLISKVILFVGEIFLRIAAAVMEIGISLNTQLANSSIIKEGYNIGLSVANIALVVAIVTVAFMVMLRRSGANKLLLRFIAVALTINFGFYIMINLLIRPVDSITSQIHQAINVHPEGGFYSTFGQSLLGEGIDPGPVITDALEEDPTAAAELGPDSLIGVLAIALAKVIFIGVAEFVLVITMFAYAFMLLARYVAMSFFIILFPLAVIFWIFPKLQVVGGNLWKQWFQAFTRWLLFAPIGLFFIWLGVRLITDSNVLQTADGDLETFLVTVGNMVIVVGFLLGGLIVSNKMSIAGAGVAQAVMNKAGGWAKTRGKLQYAEAKTRLGNSEKAKKRLEGLASTWAGEPGFRGALKGIAASPVRAFGRGAMGTMQRGEGTVKDHYKKKYGNWAPYRLKAILSGLDPESAEYGAIQSIMDSKGSMWETPIGKNLGRIYNEGVVAKNGLQKEQIGWMKEGLPPAVVAGIDRGESPEALMALLAVTGDDMSDNALASIGDAIMADYDPGTKHYGLTDDQHKKLQTAWTDYITQRRANAFLTVKRRQKPDGQINLDRVAQDFMATNADVNGLLALSPDQQEQVIKADWNAPGGLKAREIARAEAGIDAIKDPRWNKRDKDGRTKKDIEKERIRAQIESLGSEGYLKRVRTLQASQKHIIAMLSEQFGGGEAPPAPTAEGS